MSRLLVTNLQLGYASLRCSASPRYARLPPACHDRVQKTSRETVCEKELSGTRAKQSFGDMRSQAGAWERDGKETAPVKSLPVLGATQRSPPHTSFLPSISYVINLDARQMQAKFVLLDFRESQVHDPQQLQRLHSSKSF